MAAYLIWFVLVVGWLHLGRTLARKRLPVAISPGGAALWVAVAVPSVLQVAVWPGMLTAGQRDQRTFADGQVWRLFTSMFLQDGGWAGAVFNLVILGVTVLLAGSLVRGRIVVGAFVVGGVVCNVLTLAAFDEPGAGNSMATVVLLVSVAAWSVADRVGVLCEVAFVAAAVVLLAVGDMHGLAVVVGLVLGLAARARPTS